MAYRLCAGWPRSRRIAPAPDRVLGAERAADSGSTDPQSQQVPLMRGVLGVVDECRAGVHGHEVVDELQVARLELHAKSNTWPLRQRVEIQEAGDLVRGEPRHLG